MKTDRSDCPHWIDTVDAVVLRRYAVLGCALTWASVIGFLVI